jgi:4a-hydroxytetrahydrobiopterin dehydratase
MVKIAADEARTRLQKLPGWELQGEAITREFTFKGFPEAIAFTVRLAFESEGADHHPEILINYKRVRLTYTTHSENGLTEKDFAGAERATALAA